MRYVTSCLPGLWALACAICSPFALDPDDDSEPDLYQPVGETRALRQLSELMITQQHDHLPGTAGAQDPGDHRDPP